MNLFSNSFIPLIEVFQSIFNTWVGLFLWKTWKIWILNQGISSVYSTNWPLLHHFINENIQERNELATIFNQVIIWWIQFRNYWITHEIVYEHINSTWISYFLNIEPKPNRIHSFNDCNINFNWRWKKMKSYFVISI